MQDFRGVMKEYIDRYGSDEHVPAGFSRIINVRNVEPEDASVNWEILESPKRYRKKYIFDTVAKVLPFVEMLLDYEKVARHNAKIIIEDDTVTIELYTHAAYGITAADEQYRAQADMIRDDVEFGFDDYKNDDDDGDHIELADSIRDSLNVGYTDEHDAYEFR